MSCGVGQLKIEMIPPSSGVQITFKSRPRRSSPIERLATETTDCTVPNATRTHLSTHLRGLEINANDSDSGCSSSRCLTVLVVSAHFFLYLSSTDKLLWTTNTSSSTSSHVPASYMVLPSVFTKR